MNGATAQRYKGATAQFKPQVKFEVKVKVERYAEQCIIPDKPVYLTSVIFIPLLTPVSLKTSIVK
jgi:predicted secreted Zn-dependent protease